MPMRSTTRRAASVLAAATSLLVAPAALAAPATVHVRVEGATSTLLDTTVTTTTHAITMAAGANYAGAAYSGGTETCDGRNGANPNGYTSAGATAITALDDALRAASLSWYAPFDATAADFASPYTIGGEGATSSSGPFWDLRVNYAAVTGGCELQVLDGDQVLLALDGQGKPALRLNGPDHAIAGEPVVYTVTDGGTSATVAGADVFGQSSAPNGRVTVVFPGAGVDVVRATKASAIRSAAINVCVTGSDGTPCVPAGSSAPVLDPPPPPATVAPAPARPAPAAPPCKDPTADGRCDTPLQQAPQARIGSLKEGSVFLAGHAPYSFSGYVGWPSRTDSHRMFEDATGLKVVKLRIVRQHQGRCWTFSGRRRTWRPMHGACAARNGHWFAIGAAPAWTYTLPGALAPGRYVLDVNGVDGWGRRDDKRLRGGNRIAFYVAPRRISEQR